MLLAWGALPFDRKRDQEGKIPVSRLDDPRLPAPGHPPPRRSVCRYPPPAAQIGREAVNIGHTPESPNSPPVAWLVIDPAGLLCFLVGRADFSVRKIESVRRPNLLGAPYLKPIAGRRRHAPSSKLPEHLHPASSSVRGLSLSSRQHGSHTPRMLDHVRPLIGIGRRLQFCRQTLARISANSCPTRQKKYRLAATGTWAFEFSRQRARPVYRALLPALPAGETRASTFRK